MKAKTSSAQNNTTIMKAKTSSAQNNTTIMKAKTSSAHNGTTCSKVSYGYQIQFRQRIANIEVVLVEGHGLDCNLRGREGEEEGKVGGVTVNFEWRMWS